MRPPRASLLAATAVLVLLLAGCEMPWASTPVADEPEVRPTELANIGGWPCPERLPTGEDPSGHGFGTEEPAAERPNLLAPQEAWVCRYDPVDLRVTAREGTVFGWSRAGRPEAVATDDLPALQEVLDDLGPADRGGACTADLGPRWMIVYHHEGDLTGVVVDDYGCRDVRLTDDPYGTPPGADDQEGAVGGVLDHGPDLLEVLAVGRSS